MSIPHIVDDVWSFWTTWSGCTVTCGEGINTRSRYCTNPTPTSGDKACIGSDVHKETCNTHKCPGYNTWYGYATFFNYTKCYAVFVVHDPTLFKPFCIILKVHDKCDFGHVLTYRYSPYFKTCFDNLIDCISMFIDQLTRQGWWSQY